MKVVASGWKRLFTYLQKRRIWLNEYTITLICGSISKKSKKSLDLNRKYERMIMRWWVFCLTTYWKLAHILTITGAVGNTGSVKSLTWKYSRGGKLFLQINCLRAAIAEIAHIIKYLQKGPFGWNLKMHYKHKQAVTHNWNGKFHIMQ